MCHCRRQSEIDAKARDVRLQRALEEVERFKALLLEQRVADKDHKDVNKSDYNRVFAGMQYLICSVCSGALGIYDRRLITLSIECLPAVLSRHFQQLPVMY